MWAICVCVFFRLMILMRSDFHMSISRMLPKLNCKSPETKLSLERLQGNENEAGSESSPQTEAAEGKMKPDWWLHVYNLKKAEQIRQVDCCGLSRVVVYWLLRSKMAAHVFSTLYSSMKVYILLFSSIQLHVHTFKRDCLVFGDFFLRNQSENVMDYFLMSYVSSLKEW